MPDAQLNPKKKIFESCAPDLKVDGNNVATYKGVPWTVNGKHCLSTTLVNVQIKWNILLEQLISNSQCMISKMCSQLKIKSIRNLLSILAKGHCIYCIFIGAYNVIQWYI